MRRLGRFVVTREAILAALKVRPELRLIDMAYDPQTLSFTFTLEGPGLRHVPEGNAVQIEQPERFLKGGLNAVPN